jgi:uncharacterized membrane protein YeaQ/YmgE (transglycosylase-associated protein family)
MSVGGLIVWLIIGAIAGYLASKVLTGKGMGILWDIVVGIVGAFIGGFLAGLANISASNILVEIVIAFVGAVILLLIFRAVTSRGRVRT